MRIARIHSHLNGQEHILVHKPTIWGEIREVIKGIDAELCRTKRSKEKTKKGRVLYSPKDMNKRFAAELKARGWSPAITRYWVTADHELIQRTMGLPADRQKQELLEAGVEPIASYNQTDFVKDRIAIEVQFGKYSFVAYDLFVKHMAFFVGHQIDVGIEILPMKELQAEMSSGVPYYEGELYNLIRQGRATPAVPLVIIGLAC
jgi:hypothetical protein